MPHQFARHFGQLLDGRSGHRRRDSWRGLPLRGSDVLAAGFRTASSVSAYCLPTGKQDPIGENNMVASFRFADGSIGNLTYCTVGSKTSGGERVEVYAQGIGAVTEDFKSVAVKSSTVSGAKKYWADKGYDKQLESFLSSIRSGKTPEITVLDGARSTIGCLRMLDSARGGTPMMITASKTTLQEASV